MRDIGKAYVSSLIVLVSWGGLLKHGSKGLSCQKKIERGSENKEERIGVGWSGVVRIMRPCAFAGGSCEKNTQGCVTRDRADQSYTARQTV